MKDVTQQQLDDIENALIAGMDKNDAYIFASLNSDQIAEIEDNEKVQLLFSQRTKSLEHSLLARMKQISSEQALEGHHTATAWLLEHLYPRYANKQSSAEVGSIILKMSSVGATGAKNVAELDTVEIQEPIAIEQ